MEELAATERPIIGYAQPLSRLQVSWGAILAGTATALAVTLLVWSLALAIIWTAIQPSVGALQRGLIAAFITGLVSIILGAFVGGMVAGYLPGNPRRLITRTHGFLAWCVFFLVASMAQIGFLGGLARITTDAVMTTAATAVQTTGAAVSGSASASSNLGQTAQSVLTSLGYSRAEAADMVTSAQRDVQRVLRGRTDAGATAAQQARGAFDTILSAIAAYSWLWFGTWAIAAGMSILGASSVLKRVRLVPERERAGSSEIAQHLRPAHQGR